MLMLDAKQASIIMEVCAHYKTSLEILSNSESTSLVYVRPKQIICYLLKKHTGATTAQIKYTLNYNNRGAVRYSINKIEELMKTNQVLKQTIKSLEKKIK